MRLLLWLVMLWSGILFATGRLFCVESNSTLPDHTMFHRHELQKEGQIIAIHGKTFVYRNNTWFSKEDPKKQFVVDHRSDTRPKPKNPLEAIYAAESQRLKPIVDALFKQDVWSLMDSGRCNDAEKIMRDPASLRLTDEQWIQSMRPAAERCLEICRKRYSLPDVPEPPLRPFDTSTIKNPQTVKTLRARADIRAALSAYRDYKGEYPGSLNAIVGFAGVKSMPALVLPNHPESHEASRYGSEACLDGTGDSHKPRGKDTGTWGYVSNPHSPCVGEIFIDCTHIDPETKMPWSSY